MLVQEDNKSVLMRFLPVLFEIHKHLSADRAQWNEVWPIFSIKIDAFRWKRCIFRQFFAYIHKKQMCGVVILTVQRSPTAYLSKTLFRCLKFVLFVFEYSHFHPNAKNKFLKNSYFLPQSANKWTDNTIVYCFLNKFTICFLMYFIKILCGYYSAFCCFMPYFSQFNSLIFAILFQAHFQIWSNLKRGITELL